MQWGSHLVQSRQLCVKEKKRKSIQPTAPEMLLTTFSKWEGWQWCVILYAFSVATSRLKRTQFRKGSAFRATFSRKRTPFVVRAVSRLYTLAHEIISSSYLKPGHKPLLPYIFKADGERRVRPPRPRPLAFLVAGVGFEPTTSGLQVPR